MQPKSQGRLLLAWTGLRACPWTNHVGVGWWSVLIGQGWNIHLELQKWDQHFPTTGWEEGRMVAWRKIKVLTRSLSGWGREPKSGPDKQPWGYRACFPIPCTNHCRCCSADNADDHCSHTSTCIRHRYTRVPHPETLSLLPPCTIPLGHASAPAPSNQYHASNLDWWFVSYMILYMLQCHSPKSSHPLPLAQSPKDCSIHLCLFCCLAYRISLPSF